MRAIYNSIDITSRSYGLLRGKVTVLSPLWKDLSPDKGQRNTGLSPSYPQVRRGLVALITSLLLGVSK